MSSAHRLRPAEPRDLEAIVALIGELAEFEQLTHLLEVTPDKLHPHLFGHKPGERPVAECVVGEVDGKTAIIDTGAVEELQEAAQRCAENEIPIYVLGLGANLLVGDHLLVNKFVFAPNASATSASITVRSSGARPCTPTST